MNNMALPNCAWTLVLWIVTFAAEAEIVTSASANRVRFKSAFLVGLVSFVSRPEASELRLHALCTTGI